MLEIFHGSRRIVDFPLFGEGNPNNDYGLGFYCTEHIELAKEWACADEQGGFANRYLLDDSQLSFCRLGGEEYHILNWLSILLKNRTFSLSEGLPSEARDYLLETFLPPYGQFDVVTGYRADDSYFGFATDFLNGTLSLQQLSRAMRLGKLGEQVVLMSPTAFAAIHFQEAVEAPGTLYYARRMERDTSARAEFRRMRREDRAKDGIYILDILRQNWKNDDPRLR